MTHLCHKVAAPDDENGLQGGPPAACLHRPRLCARSVGIGTTRLVALIVASSAADLTVLNTMKVHFHRGLPPTGRRPQRKRRLPGSTRRSSHMRHMLRVQGGMVSNSMHSSSTMIMHSSNTSSSIFTVTRSNSSCHHHHHLQRRHRATEQHTQHHSHSTRRRSSLLRRRARQKQRQRRRRLLAPSLCPASNRNERKSTYVFAMSRTSRHTTCQRIPRTSEVGRR